jgi:asparagine synthetase B (glutamine-hydrolysing)
MPGIGGFALTSPQDIFQKKRIFLDNMRWDENYIEETINDDKFNLCLAASSSGVVPISKIVKPNRFYSVFYGEIHSENLKGKNCRIQHDFLLSGIINEGYEFLNRVEGVFLIALWDRENQNLLIANDAFGQYPLNYYFENGNFIFSSQAKAITKIIESAELNRQSLAEHLAYGLILNGQTWFKNIKRLWPGSCLIYKDNKLSEIQYYKPIYTPKNDISFSKKIESFVFAFNDAVRNRWNQNENTAVALTGGNDTRIIWSAYSKEGMKATAVTHGNPDSSDMFIANKISKKLNVVHQKYLFDSALKVFPDSASKLTLMSEGFLSIAGAHAVSYYESLQNDFDVLIDGAGGPFYRRQVFRKYSFEKFHHPSLASFFNNILLKRHFINGVVEKDFANETGEIIYNKLKKYFNKYSEYGQKEDLIDLFYFHQFAGLSYSANVLLQSHFIKCRQPLYDRHLFNLARTFTYRQRKRLSLYRRIIHINEPKLEYIPLVSSSTIVPYKGFIWKRIIPFGINYFAAKINLPNSFRIRRGIPPFNISELFRDQLNSYLKEILLDPLTLKRPFWDGGRFEQMIKEHESGSQDYSDTFSNFMTAELFLRDFF